MLYLHIFLIFMLINIFLCLFSLHHNHRYRNQILNFSLLRFHHHHHSNLFPSLLARQHLRCAPPLSHPYSLFCFTSGLHGFFLPSLPGARPGTRPRKGLQASHTSPPHRRQWCLRRVQKVNEAPQRRQAADASSYTHPTCSIER